MAASYPGVLPSFTTKVDNADINWAADINRLQDEIVAITAELGVEPSAGFLDVRERLDHLQTTKSDVGHRHDERYVRRSGFTATGDLLVGTGENNSTTLGSGSPGQVLITDPAQTAGLRWKTMAHSDLTGLAQDDHLQYHTTERHAAVNHGPLLANHSVTIFKDFGGNPSVGQVPRWNGTRYLPRFLIHNDLSGLTVGNPHSQYPRKAGHETIGGTWDFQSRPTIYGQPVIQGRDGTGRIFVRASNPSNLFHTPGDIWIRP